MCADPSELNAWLSRRQSIELLNELEILDRAAFAFPAALFPAYSPFVNRIDAELTV